MGVDYSGHIKYNRNKVWDYAVDYFNDRNPRFFDYHDNDCANYASQCLLAGGIKMNNKWHSYRSINWLAGSISWLVLANNYRYNWDVTPAWRLVVDQYNYFKKQSYIKCKITIRSGVAIKDIIKNRGKDIKIGDLMYFDKNGDGTPDHAAIVSRVTKVLIYYTAHSHDWLRRSIAYYLNDHKKAKIYILHIDA